ncbi:MAG TPA: hypothetical protein VLC55_05335, partial [Burkholderiales bacterium]|nr:hypothetical protein [Burkholderiales bacterium]
MVVLFCLFVLFPPLSFSESPSEEQPDGLAESGSLSVINRALEARRSLDDVALDSEVRHFTRKTVKTTQAGKGTRKQNRTTAVTQEGVHVTRQFAIAALDEERREWHTILLDIPYPLPPDENYSFRVLSDGYRVKHISGRGITKLNFDVRPLSEDRPLVPYGLKALWGTGATKKDSAPEFEVAVYTPIYPTFFSQDLAVRGRDFLYAAAEDVLGALTERGVRSKSFPERLLADVIPADLLVNVGLIEQMDPAA